MYTGDICINSKITAKIQR